MNIATLLINSSAFFIVFILLGLLARSIYRRRVVEPHRRQIEALGEFSRDLIEDLYDAQVENLRLKQNICYLADRYEHTWRRLMLARAIATIALHSKGEVAVRKKAK